MQLRIEVRTIGGPRRLLRIEDIITVQEQDNGSAIINHKYGDAIYDTLVRDYDRVVASIVLAMRQQHDHERACAARKP